MPALTFGPAAPPQISNLIDLIESLSTGGTLVGFNPTLVQINGGGFEFYLSGTGFAQSGGFLTGGTIDNIQVIQIAGGQSVLSMTGLGLSAVALMTAAQQENLGIDTAAIENLFLGMDWTITGRAVADQLPVGATSSDGVDINLKGNDLIRLAGGRDVFNAGDGNDTLRGDGGNDTLWGGRGDDRVSGGTGNDKVYGGGDNDSLYGDTGFDLLSGGTGNDLLNGGDEADTLNGGAGTDTLIGGAGIDTFVFSSIADIGLGATRDRIQDFISGSDVIDLSGAGVKGLVFTGFTGLAHQARFVVNGANGVIRIDDDGDGVSDADLLLIGVTALAVTDIIFA